MDDFLAIALPSGILGSLYQWLVIYPKTQRLWQDLLWLTDDEKLAHKLVQRAVRKHFWRGQVYWYEIALASYRHHLATKRQPPASKGKGYRSKQPKYKPRNRPSAAPTPPETSTPPPSLPTSPSGLKYGLRKPRSSTPPAKNYQPKNPTYIPRNRHKPTPQVPRPPAREAEPIGLILKLDQLTKDRATSERLIDRAVLRYPERSKQWCVEKVIFDLKRDRH
ncbi:MAG: hypothetical protein AAF609_12585 [Cyanobacteria bacterium P01_C01_bin.120]